jgi:hypothetical protein
MSATVQTDAQGFFAFTDTVAAGTLIVTPSLSGFTFTPPNKTYNNVSSNKVANFLRN